MQESKETITRTVTHPTGTYPALPPLSAPPAAAIVPTLQTPAPVHIYNNAASPMETIGQKLAGQTSGIAGAVLFTYLAQQRVLTGPWAAACILFCILPLELSRRILAVFQLRHPAAVVAATAAAGAATAAAARAQSAGVTVMAFVVGLSAVLNGCRSVPYTRPQCETPGRYQCEQNHPRFCSMSKQLTDAGDLNCGETQHCAINDEGTAYCAVGRYVP